MSQILVKERNSQERAICPNSTILLSSVSSDRPNVVLEQHLFPAFEQPEVTAVGHILSVHLSDALELEHCEGHGWQRDRLNPQDICLTPNGVSFQARWQDVAESIVIMLDDDWLKSIAAGVFLTDSFELTLQRGKQDRLLYHLALTLRNEIANKHESGRVYYDSVLNTLAVHLISHYGVRQPSAAEKGSGLPQDKLDNAIAFIRQNYTRKLKLAEMAEITGLSEFYFDRLFKKSTGLTPHQYLTQYRIECAKQLLQKEDLTATQIAKLCGFSNQSYFTKLFRQIVGTTPLKYRREVRDYLMPCGYSAVLKDSQGIPLRITAPHIKRRSLL